MASLRKAVSLAFLQRARSTAISLSVNSFLRADVLAFVLQHQRFYGPFDNSLNLPPCYHGGFILTDRKLFRRDPRMDNPTGRHFLHRTFAEDLFPVPQALSPAAS